MKYKEWLSVWLENYIKPSAKQRTYDTYLQMIEKSIVPKIGDYELDDLTPIVLQSFVTELLNNGNEKTHNGLAVSTVNLIITIIQNSLKTAFMLGKTKEYIANKIKRPKLKQKNVSCFSVAEQKKIEQAVTADNRSKMFGVVLCLYTGLRIGELLALYSQAPAIVPFEILSLICACKKFTKKFQIYFSFPPINMLQNSTICSIILSIDGLKSIFAEYENEQNEYSPRRKENRTYGKVL